MSPFDENVLVFDTETTADVEQRLLYGTFRLYRDRTLVEEGVFYADQLSRAKKKQIIDWATEHGIAYCSQRSFFWNHVRNIGLLVALNEAFDLATLMPIARPAGKRKQQGRFLGGFALNTEWKRRNGRRKRLRHPITVKRLNAHAALFDIGPRGRALDVRTLYWALTNKGGGLKEIADSLETEDRKTSLDTYGVINPEALKYARNDTLVTAECLWKLAEEYERHPIDLHPADALSPAAIVKGYYRAMGVTPLRDRFTGFPEDVSGAAFSAYFGGRVEARIVRQPIPIVKLDALSMYPLVFRLLGLWSFVIADRIEAVDATDDVRKFLDGVTYESILDPAAWKNLCAIVEVEPDGDLLPTRAHYAKGRDPNIGLNYLWTEGNRVWCSLPDIVDAKLLSGKTPRALRAIRFQPGAHIETLVETFLRGAVRAEPGEDMARLTIELRKTAANDPRFSRAERDRLDLFLKVFANSGFYGIFAQVTRDERNGYDADYLSALAKWRRRVVAFGQRIYTERVATQPRQDADDEPATGPLPADAPPSRTLAQKEAAAQLAPDRHDAPRTLVCAR